MCTVVLGMYGVARYVQLCEAVAVNLQLTANVARYARRRKKINCVRAMPRNHKCSYKQGLRHEDSRVEGHADQALDNRAAAMRVACHESGHCVFDTVTKKIACISWFHDSHITNQSQRTS